MGSFRRLFLLLIAASLISCTGEEGGWDGGSTITKPPVFSRTSGTFLASQTITLSSGTPGCTIRYTTDGSVPTDNTGTIYNGPFVVSGTSTITAVAFKPGLNPSHASAETFAIRGLRSFTAGTNHTLLITNDNMVWGLGANDYGQLGMTPFPGTSEPSWIIGFTDVVQIAAGESTSYALRRDGTVWALGKNFYGELGDGTLVNRDVPVRVLGLSGIRSISAGGLHALAVRDDNTVWAWGHNFFGQLGDNTLTNRSTPVQVMSGVATVAASYAHSVALKTDGTVWTWGDNYYGQLGTGTFNSSTSPVQVVGLTGSVRSIFAGTAYVSGAILSDNTAMTWGYRILAPQNAPWMNSIERPKPVPGAAGLGSLACGESSGIMRTAAGALFANNTRDYLWSTPSALAGLNTTQIAAGPLFFLALTEDGRLWGWGANGSGQLGIPSTATVPGPVPFTH